MDFEPVWRWIDGLVGGSQAGRVVQIPEDLRVRRAFRATLILLIVAALLSAGAVFTAIVLAEERQVVALPVWIRCTAMMGISLTLFYFAARARLGYWWAYRRLQLFSRVFPLVAVVLAAIPGLFPAWVALEQLAFAVLLIGVSLSLRATPLKSAFASRGVA